jgi:threonine/homoserine/homoserine lactone efflux protein
LLRANQILFIAMHVIGAAVLVYLGVTAWRTSRRDNGELGAGLRLPAPSGRTPAAGFRASLVTVPARSRHAEPGT